MITVIFKIILWIILSENVKLVSFEMFKFNWNQTGFIEVTYMETYMFLSSKCEVKGHLRSICKLFYPNDSSSGYICQ